ncbi:cryptochrome, partial [Jaminaea rosea]
MSSTEAVQDDGPPPSVLICLLRLDLRIEDNALWHFAHTGHAPPSTARPTSHNASKLPREEELFSRSTHLLPLYVFDEREVELSGLPGYVRKGPEARTQNFNFWKTGAFRARFIAESVYDLRSRLRDRGSDLCIRFGRVEDVVANLVKAFQDQSTNVEGVWMQKEMTSGEVGVEERIEERLRPINVPVKYVHCKTLIHPADLPFEIEETPDVFTPFRKRVEALGPAMVRPLYHAPAAFKAFPRTIPQTEDYSLDVTYEVDVDGLATADPESKPKDPKQTSFYDILRYLVLPLNEVHFPPTVEGSSILQQRHHASAFPLRGGESSALERLDWYFVRGKSPDSTTWGKSDPPPVARYKQTRNNLIGHSYSTKMSPFLAYGSISPRQIWQALMHHESIFGEDQNIYWVKFELLWRDYFFFVAEKFGDLLFHLGGFELATDPPQAQKKLVPGWWKTWDPIKEEPPQELTRMLEGRTGIPFIDANIRELRESGFLSNRGRQNIASYVAHDLGYDWRIGAEFFQSYLIDYDPTSNYGNWAYVAGVGNDPRASRRFNIIKQAKDYDSHGEYVKTWLPVLRGLPTYYVHTPWLLDAEERRRYGVKASEQIVTMDSYPGRPMTEDEGWKKHYERKEGAGSRMHGNPQEKVKDGKVKRFRKP